MKMMKRKYLLALLFVLNFLNFVQSQCRPDLGCLFTRQFRTYVTKHNPDGFENPNSHVFEDKFLYLFTDRIVIFKGSDENNSEGIERIINFGDIILDCGTLRNKLCHAGEYPNVNSLPSYEIVKKNMSVNTDVLCIIIPFFENGFQKMHDKMAYICETANSQLFEIINFKSNLSRLIENYQLRLSHDRYNGYNGLIKRSGKFFIEKDGKPISVLGRIMNKGIIFVTNNEKKSFVKYYSFFQIKDLGVNGAWMLKDALAKQTTDEQWNKGFENEPDPNCCIYFRGQSQNLLMCLANSSGGAVESNSSTCDAELKDVYAEIKTSVMNVVFSNSYNLLAHDEKKRFNCEGNEWKIMRYRLNKAREFFLMNDCKMLQTHSNDKDDIINIMCMQFFDDQTRLYTTLLGLDNRKIEKSLNVCLATDPQADIITDDKFKGVKSWDVALKIIRNESGKTKGNIDTDKARETSFSSFVQIEQSDMLSDDDGEGDEKKTEVNLLQTKTKVLAKAKQDDQAVSEKVQIARKNSIKSLQKRKTWMTAGRESITDKFDKYVASGGIRNADEFVSFLGYLRDASVKASHDLMKVEQIKELQNKQ